MNSAHRLSFGPFEFEPAAGKLWKYGYRLKLQRKSAEILACLLERPGELVPRAEIDKRLWPEGTYVDYDLGVRVALKKLRDALNDSSEEAVYIQTIRGEGYRFIAPVTPVLPPTPQVEIEPPQVVEPAALPQPRVRQRWWAVGVALASAVATLAIVLLLAAHPAPAPQPSAERLTTSDVITGAISPDGKYLVYSTKEGLWLQQLPSGEVRQLETQPKLRPWHLAWYSDSSAFLATNLDGVWRVPAMGGMALRVYGRAGQASPSPDGAHITLKTFGTGDDIWVTDGSGENPRLVAKRQRGETLSRAVWSPHGKRLAYVRRWADANGPYGKSADIETVRPDGSDPRVVVKQLRLSHLTWMADGRLVFSVISSDPHSKIEVANLWTVAVNEDTGEASSRPEALTNWPDFNFALPSATVDGRTIAFVRDRSYTNLYVADLAPGAAAMSPLRQLTTDTAISLNTPTAWDPATNDLLYFVSGATRKEAILRRTPVGTPARPAVPPSEFDQDDARFSADGRWLLWLRLSAERNSAEVLAMPRDGGPVSVLDKQAGSGFALSCPVRSGAECVFSAEQLGETAYRAVSPDSHSSRELFRSAVSSFFEVAPGGSQLLMCAPGADGEDKLLLLELAASNKKTEVPFSCDATEFTSLPDGSGWLLTRSTGDATEVVRLDPAGRTKVLWKGDQWLGTPLVSPDGRHVAFVSGGRERNIWALHF